MGKGRRSSSPVAPTAAAKLRASLARSRPEWILLVVLIVAGALRFEALEKQCALFPKGTDGSLEFQRYAENLLDYTLHGERFPEGTRMHRPVLSIILAGVFTLAGRSSYVQYWTTLAISLLTIVGIYFLVKKRYGPREAVIAALALAVNTEAVHNAVQGNGVQLLILVLSGLLYLVLLQENHWTARRAWLLGLVAAVATQTREEGWFLLAAFYLALAWVHRRRLTQCLREYYPVLAVPVLVGVFHGLFQRANHLVDLSERYGTFLFTREYIDHVMPSWYHRLQISQEVFQISYLKWLLGFRSWQSLFARLVEGGQVLAVGLGQLLTVPVLVIGLIGLAVVLSSGLRAARSPVAFTAGVWAVVMIGLLTPIAPFIGDDTIGGRNHYLLPACVLLLFAAGEGMQKVAEWGSGQGARRLARQGLVGALVLLIGSYGYRQFFQYGKEVPRPLEVKGEFECEPGFTALAAKDFDTAYRVFAEVLADNPRYAPAHLGCGIVLLNQGDLHRGASELEQAIRLFPWYAEAYIGLATLQVYMERLDEARHTLARCFAMRPDYVPAHLLSAQVFFLLKDEEKAIVHYREYLDGVGRARARMIKLVAGMQERNPAAKSLLTTRRILERPQGTPAEFMIDDDLYAFLYLHLDHRGFFAIGGQGVDLLRIKDRNIYYDLGNLLARSEKIEEALEQYQAAITLFPGDAWTLNNLGLAEAKKGQLDKAESWWQRAIALDPSLSWAHNNLGCLYAQKGLYAEAQQHLAATGAGAGADAVPHANLELLKAKHQGLAAGGRQSFVYQYAPVSLELPAIATAEVSSKIRESWRMISAL